MNFRGGGGDQWVGEKSKIYLTRRLKKTTVIALKYIASKMSKIESLNEKWTSADAIIYY